MDPRLPPRFCLLLLPFPTPSFPIYTDSLPPNPLPSTVSRRCDPREGRPLWIRRRRWRHRRCGCCAGELGRGQEAGHAVVGGRCGGCAGTTRWRRRARVCRYGDAAPAPPRPWSDGSTTGRLTSSRVNSEAEFLNAWRSRAPVFSGSDRLDLHRR